MGTLFYIPEVLTTCGGERSVDIRSIADEMGWKFVCLEYPSYDPTDIYIAFTQQILDNLHPTNNIFFGTGLGGFWANFFAKDYIGKTVLINPCVNPSSSLFQFLPADSDSGSVEDWSGKKHAFTESMISRYNIYETLVRTHYGTVIFLSKDDFRADWRRTSIMFKNDEDVCVRLYNDGGHTMEKHFEQIATDLRKLMEIPFYLLPYQAKKFRDVIRGRKHEFT